MSDDPIAVLERELVAAASRQAAPASRPPAPGRRRGFTNLRAAATAAAVLVPVLIVAAALMLTGAPQRSGQAGSSGRPTLTGVLAVLRRPQRPSDLMGVKVSSVAGSPNQVQRKLLRRVLVRFGTGAVVPVQLVVTRPRPGAALRLATAASVSQASGGESSSIIFFSVGQTAAQLVRRGMVTGVSGGTGHGIDVVVIVPDGVVRVVYASSGGVTRAATVQDNAAGLLLPSARFFSHASITWYGSGGRVIARVAPQAPLPSAPTPTSPITSLPGPATILGVLRRPQTPADLVPRRIAAPMLPGASRTAGQGVAQIILERLARVTSWGERIWVALSRPPSPAEIRRLRPPLRAAAEREARAGDTIAILTAHGGAGGIPIKAIENGQAQFAQVEAGSRGGSPVEVISVVPDGVSQVVYELNPASQARRPLTARVRVKNNVAAVRVAGASVNQPRSVTWYGPGGRLVKRFGRRAGPA